MQLCHILSVLMCVGVCGAKLLLVETKGTNNTETENKDRELKTSDRGMTNTKRGLKNTERGMKNSGIGIRNTERALKSTNRVQEQFFLMSELTKFRLAYVG